MDGGIMLYGRERESMGSNPCLRKGCRRGFPVPASVRVAACER